MSGYLLQCYPKAFLEGFRGYLQTDGYAGYNSVEGAIHVGCWAHVRRKFNDALEAAGKGKKSPTATQGSAYCTQLFKLEEQWKDLTPEERQKKRSEGRVAKRKDCSAPSFYAVWR